ncbi:YigZ family protein [Gleimia coleocanis DSM 15436]|uniref:YigZ family protein n=1 Tax=Gleimia coleocanis DSM 15436 TaxID=525245 RepID=C0W1B2_9ACTO|nr:YigZ family protein [Gleimia coleocanis]EEH63601.1 YigZ family protein [Gleimia coleocanis DSM 15436]
MRSIKEGTWIRNEIEILRSRFITTLAYTPTEVAARELIAQVRNEYPDARHNCSAFVVKPEGLNEIGHSNDDGEPSGTAGMPMLEVFLRNQLVNVTAVTTRYFGGILLGAGGLVRAYSTSVSEALNLAEIVELVPMTQWCLPCPHATAGRIEADLRTRGINVTGIEYTETANIMCAIPPENVESFHALVGSITTGLVTPIELSSTTVAIPAKN